MDTAPKAYPAFRLVAQFADGQRLYFDGLNEQQARQRMEAAQTRHGEITWYDGVTDLDYENGMYHAMIPPPPTVTLFDFTDYPDPFHERED